MPINPCEVHILHTDPILKNPKVHFRADKGMRHTVTVLLNGTPVGWCYIEHVPGYPLPEWDSFGCPVHPTNNPVRLGIELGLVKAYPEFGTINDLF